MSKHIVITGASRGIGLELVKILAPENKILVLTRDITKAQTLVQHPNITWVSFDLADKSVGERASEVLKKHMPVVDVLINNSGALIHKPILEISRSEMERIYAVNVFGLMEVCQAVIPFIQPGGHIVNIGSMGGFQGSTKFNGLSVYSSSKAAVAGFSECLAEELKDQNIQVNCLALGAAQTEMLAEAFPGYQAPITATKMATFIADFALRGNQWINGKVIPVSATTP